jgi:hypothetical protein
MNFESFKTMKRDYSTYGLANDFSIPMNNANIISFVYGLKKYYDSLNPIIGTPPNFFSIYDMI